MTGVGGMASVRMLGSDTPALLVSGVALPTAPVPQYTAQQITTIKWFEFNNTDTVSRTVTVYAVPSGGAVGVATQVMKIPLAAGEHVPIASAEVILTGYTLQLIADAAGVVRASVSGKVQVP